MSEKPWTGIRIFECRLLRAHRLWLTWLCAELTTGEGGGEGGGEGEGEGGWKKRRGWEARRIWWSQAATPMALKDMKALYS